MLREFPIISSVIQAGADDRIFDGLLLVGPVVLGVIAVAGRSLLTETIAVAYIMLFVTYTLFRGLSK